MTQPARFLSSMPRLFLVLLSSMILLGLLAMAGSIPFVYESQTIHYKFGLDKALLCTGQVLGMTAATLLLLQLALSARLKALDHIFGLPRLYLFHRVNAVTIGMLALSHPLFVFASEDITNLVWN